MQLVETPQALRSVKAQRSDRPTWGLVPTMGAIHAGHLSLISAAKAQCDAVMVSLFVNPKQFSAGEDLHRYPRDFEADRATLEAAGVDLLFAPSVQTIYPEHFATQVTVKGLSDILEGAHRPGFFTGVATVVTKLLLIAQADKAFFGEKDYQQLLVIRRLAQDLNIPSEIIGCPTLRQAGGLAYSSRNQYLSPAAFAQAPRLAATLQAALLRWQNGEAAGAVEAVEAWAKQQLSTAGFRVDYVAIRDAETLAAPLRPTQSAVRILAAAWLEDTRLIDNWALNGPVPDEHGPA